MQVQIRGHCAACRLHSLHSVPSNKTKANEKMQKVADLEKEPKTGGVVMWVERVFSTHVLRVHCMGYDRHPTFKCGLAY